MTLEQVAQPKRNWAAYNVFASVIRTTTPKEGWIAVFLLIASLIVVVRAINAAHWVDAPSLTGIVTVGALAGMMTAKLSRNRIAAHLLATVGGFALVYWSTASLLDTDTYWDQFRQLNTRLMLWWETARGPGIGLDTAPFIIALATLGWVLSYISAWAAFSLRNIWLSVLPGGISLTSALSYLPDTFAPYLVLYLFIAMLLVIRLNVLQRERQWESQGVGFQNNHGISVLRDSLVFLVPVFLITGFAPARTSAINEFRDTWNSIRSPIQTTESQFGRLFAGLPSRRPTDFRSFGRLLPFQGTISLTDEPLFQVKSDEKLYWRSRVYPIYTPKGWIEGETEEITIGETINGSDPQMTKGTVEQDYTVTLVYAPSTLPMSTLPVEGDVPLTVGVPPQFDTWLYLDPTIGLEPDIPDGLRAAWSLPERSKIMEWIDGEFRARPMPDLADTLLKILPRDFLISEILVRRGGGSSTEVVDVESMPGSDYTEALRSAIARGSLLGIHVKRSRRAPPDVLHVLNQNRLERGESYRMVSEISVATPEDLRVAGKNYPGWITDHYLQLPNTSAMNRIEDLATTLTYDKRTPYDKAVAIQAFLHEFEYTQTIPTPPFDADGVDYFLFTLRRGYSDYFGSAMTVMLRSIGIPARLVAGYAPGEWLENQEAYLVKDLHSHAWTEAYFPGYGWVEFEPTPGYGTDGPAGLGQGNLGEGTLGNRMGQEAGEPPQDPAFTGDDSELDESEVVGLRETLANPLTPQTIAILIGIVASGGVLWYLYHLVFVWVSLPFGMFARLHLLATLTGSGASNTQTPFEFVDNLRNRFPSIEQDLLLIGRHYSRVRYGQKQLEAGEREQLTRAWARTRRHILIRTILRQQGARANQMTNTEQVVQG